MAVGGLKGNNLTKVKKQNESLIKEVIYKYAPVSRIEISEILDLTPPTITTNISAMLEQGLVYECAAITEENGRALGRKPVKLDFVEDALFVIGIEITPYQTTICLCNLRGKEKTSLHYQVQETNYNEGLAVLTQKIEEIIENSQVKRERILGVGIGLPGLIDQEIGTVQKSPLRMWNDQLIRQDLGRKLDLPIILENNAKARAIGEELFGKELRPDVFAYYLISYGIACPLYIKNSMLQNKQWGAGEAGHMVAVLNGPKCETCGNSGCLEEVASERVIVRMIKEEIVKGRKSIITTLCKSIEEITIKEIILAQQQNDALADEVVKGAITYLGAMLANIINLINPPLVIVDGYMMIIEKNQKQFLEDTRKHIFGLYNEETKIEFLEFNSLTGARAAAALAIKTYFINTHI